MNSSTGQTIARCRKRLFTSLGVLALSLTFVSIVSAGATTARSWSAPIAIAGLPVNSFVDVDVVACSSAGNCTGAGTYPGATASSNVDFTVTENHGVWGRARELTGLAFLPTQMSCASPGNCDMVGSDDSNQVETLAVEHAGRWSTPALVTSLIPSSLLADPSSIVCPSPGNCAIGGTDAAGDLDLISETGGVWGTPAVITSASGPDQPDGSLTPPAAVTCPSAGDCVAAGIYSSTFDAQGDTEGVGYVVSETNGVWGDATEIPDLGALNQFTGAPPTIYALDCGSVGNCVLGGEYNVPHTSSEYFTEPFLASETKGVWGNATEVPDVQAWNVLGASQVNAIVCFASGECQAGGTYGDGKGLGRSFVATERDGSSWTVAQVQGANAGTNFELEQLSCSSPGNCVATNAPAPNAKSAAAAGELATESHGKWAPAYQVEVAGRTGVDSNTGVNDVACAAGNYCAAVGYYTLVPQKCTPTSPGAESCDLSGGQTAAYVTDESPAPPITFKALARGQSLVTRAELVSPNAHYRVEIISGQVRVLGPHSSRAVMGLSGVTRLTVSLSGAVVSYDGAKALATSKVSGATRLVVTNAGVLELIAGERILLRL